VRAGELFLLVLAAIFAGGHLISRFSRFMTRADLKPKKKPDALERRR
jgi:hypothetical protein